MLAQPFAHVQVVVQGGKALNELLEQLVAHRGIEVRHKRGDVTTGVVTDGSHGHEEALHLLHTKSRGGSHL